MRDSKKTSAQKKVEDVFFKLARTHLTRSRYISPEDFSVRLAKKGAHRNDGMLFPLGTPDETLAINKAAGIFQDINEHGWDWVLANHSREFVVGFSWNQDPALVTYTTLTTRTRRIKKNTSPEAEGKTIGVLLIIPDQTLRNTMESWIDSLGGMHCPFAFESIDDALKSAPVWQGKVIFALCDCGFWGTPSHFPEILGEIRKHVPVVPMIFVNISDALFLQMIGARYGYILRRTLPENALEPIRHVESKPEAWSDAVRRYNASLWHNAQAGTPVSAESDNPKELTHREAEILQGLSRGLLNKEIAARLDISVNTVRNHICNIFQKLGISTRTEAVAWYLNR